MSKYVRYSCKECDSTYDLPADNNNNKCIYCGSEAKMLYEFEGSEQLVTVIELLNSINGKLNFFKIITIIWIVICVIAGIIIGLSF